jgi:hypothetical protein
MGTLASLLEVTGGDGHRAGCAGPAPIQCNSGRPAASKLRPPWAVTTVSSPRPAV